MSDVLTAAREAAVEEPGLVHPDEINAAVQERLGRALTGEEQAQGLSVYRGEVGDR